MNNKFKRALSSILAFVMLASCVCVMNVSSVLAGTQVTYTLTMPSSATAPSSNGSTTELASNTTAGVTVSWLKGNSNDAITTVSSNNTYGSTTYTNAFYQGGSSGGCLKIDGIVQGDEIGVIFYGTSNSSAVTISKALSTYIADKDNDDSSTLTLTARAVSKATHEAQANGTYYASFTTAKGYMYAVTVTRTLKDGYAIQASGNENYKGTFSFEPDVITAWNENTNVVITYTGDDYSLAENTSVKAIADNFEVYETAKTATYDVSKLTLTPKTYSFKVAENSTYKGTFTLSKEDNVAYGDEVTLTYEGTDYTMTAQTFSVANKTSDMAIEGTTVTITPNSSWFTKILSRVHVAPTVSGNETVYNFKTTEDSYLVDKADALTDEAYSVDADGCHVLLTTNGAKLDDNSTDDPAKLVIPFAKTSGKYTISGTVTPTNAVGSKWWLVDFGSVAIMSDSKSNVAFDVRGNNGSEHTTNAGAVTKDSKIEYTVVFDLDAQTATATIKNGSLGTIENVEVECTEISNITFMTNGSGAQSGGKDRALLIPSVTITKAEEEVTNVFSYKDFSYQTGDGICTIYVIGSISKADAGAAEKVGFFAGLTAESATNETTRTELFSTNTVANMVVDYDGKIIAEPESDTYFAAGVLTADMSSVTLGKVSFYVVPFTVTADGTALGAAEKVDVSLS